MAADVSLHASPALSSWSMALARWTRPIGVRGVGSHCSDLDIVVRARRTRSCRQPGLACSTLLVCWKESSRNTCSACSESAKDGGPDGWERWETAGPRSAIAIMSTLDEAGEAA
jgi:hypothetical protein